LHQQTGASEPSSGPPRAGSRREVSTREVIEVKAMLGLLFIVSAVFFLSSFQNSIAPYWEGRFGQTGQHLEGGRYREALAALMIKASPPRSDEIGPEGRPLVRDEAVAGARVAHALGIDLENGTLNGRAFTDYTLGELTAVLGSPTWIRDPGTFEIRGRPTLQGSRIKYHWSGLEFRFRHPDLDPGERCHEVCVQTARVWDHEAGLHYKPFPGRLARGLSGEWGVERVRREILAPAAESGRGKLTEEPRGHSLAFGDHTVCFTYGRDSLQVAPVRLSATE